ncbi:gliding motility-associated C-terminal domain-containing protein [Cryomorphaceae bacterium]|nr:gliding motility-associated C-terminal domain-containing protein [Cryomorphaceae bacterium]
MRSTVSLLTRFFVFMALCVVHSVSGQNLYHYNDDNQIFRIEVATGTATLYVTHQPIWQQNGTDISFHPNGSLYVLSVFGELYEVDTLSGAITQVTNFPPQAGSSNYRALTTDANGIFYAGNANGRIFTYSLTGNQVVELGNLGRSIVGDLTFYDGELYTTLGNPDSLARVDLSPPISSTGIAGLLGGPFIPDNGLSTISDGCGNERTFMTVYDIDKNGFSTLVEYDWSSASYSFVSTLPGNAVGSASKKEYLASLPKLNLDSTQFSSACGRGSIFIDARGGQPPYSYQLNGVPFESTVEFNDLPSGVYSVRVQDARGCLDSIKVEIIGTEPISINLDEATNPNCGKINGIIAFSATGGTGALQYSLNGLDFFTSGYFDRLGPGDYDLEVEDEEGCSSRERITLTDELEGCTIQVPNVFSPNGDGNNDVFIIQGLAGRLNTFRVYNRWGTKVYDRINYLNDWSPRDLSEGTYYYVLSVEGLKDLTGFLTLVR